VVLIDTNAREVRTAKRAGLKSLAEDAMQINPDDHIELYDCGNLLAFTSNAELNQVLCRRWEELLDGQTYRWQNPSYESEPNEHLMAGKRLWKSLPLSRWMQPNEDVLDLRIESADQGAPPAAESILLTWDGSSILLGPPKEIGPSDKEWLVYDANRADPHHGLPLLRDNVIFTNHSDLFELYREMLGHFQQQHREIAAEQLLNEMWSHEEEFTSLVGHGIAIPHVRTDGIKESVLMVARPQGSLVCPMTGNAVELVFMLLSPTEKPVDHLRQLANIARLVGTQKHRDVILAANSELGLHDAIMNYA
jgi:mannitol/fructose-specific phosphotransferase system IIA component (Ntr-type)